MTRVNGKRRGVIVIASKDFLKCTGLAGCIAIAGLAALDTQPAKAQGASEISRQVINSTIQSVIQTIRDRLQRKSLPREATTRPLRFAPDGSPTAQYFDEVFGALGYAKSPMVTKAPAAPPPPPPPLQWAISGTGSLDQQRTTVAGFETTTNTEAATGTGSVTKIGVFGPSDAWVVGVVGGGSFSQQSGVRTTTPSVGTFTAYVNGGFSADFTFLTSWSHTTTPLLGAPTPNSTAYSYTGDVQYKFDLATGWWIEPTVGVTFTQTTFDAVGAVHGESTQVQGGARIGTEVLWNGVRVQPTITGLAYSNVHISTGGIVGGVAAGTDEGQVWGKGALKFTFLFTDQFSAFIEGNVRGTSGTVDAIGYGGLIGAQVTF